MSILSINPETKLFQNKKGIFMNFEIVYGTYSTNLYTIKSFALYMPCIFLNNKQYLIHIILNILIL